MDVRGFDFFAIVKTVKRPDGMSVPLQIKSSPMGMWTYFQKREDYRQAGVIVLVIREHMSAEHIRSYTYRKLQRVRTYEGQHYADFLQRISKRPLSRIGRWMKSKISRKRK